MSGNNSANVALQDPNNAVDDYLDSLLDDSFSERDHALSPEQGNGDAVSVSGGQNIEEPPATVISPIHSSDTRSSEKSSHSSVSQHSEADAEGSPALVNEYSEVPTTAEVDMHSNAAGTPNPELADKAPSAQLFAYFKFQTMGINFAVPAEQYVGDFPCPEDIASKKKDHEWLLGEMRMDEKRIRVADIAVMVIPNTRRHALPSKTGSRRVIQIGRGDWGVFCEGEVERIELPLENIHWRTKHGKRQWLAGTIVDQKCALLDIAEVERMLDHGEWQE